MGARILVVEDNMHDRSLVAFLLEAFGHVPLLAVNGQEGLGRARSERPDLILMDIIMPGMDGYETLRALRTDPEISGTPVVAMTILSSPGQREEALVKGFDGYIPKPLIPESFGDRLDEFIPRELRSRPPEPPGRGSREE